MKALFLLLMLSMALFTQTAKADHYTTEQKVIIANEECFVVKAWAGGLSPRWRVRKINERLAYILGHENLRPRNVRRYSLAGGDVAIYVGRSLLCTVTSEDALVNRTDAWSLSRIWVRNLRYALPRARP